MKKKNPAAVALGKLGGKARAESLTAEERTAIASKAAIQRAKSLTRAERRRIAMLGVKARLARKKGEQ